MWKDPIVAEVRAAREAYAKRFGYDLKKIGADLMKKQRVRAAAAVKSGSKKAAKGKTKTATRRKAA